MQHLNCDNCGGAMEVPLPGIRRDYKDFDLNREKKITVDLVIFVQAPKFDLCEKCQNAALSRWRRNH